MYLLFAMLIMAVVTYIPRVLPLTLFNKKIQSVYIRSFLHYVPYAVLGAMTFPHVFYSTKHMPYAIIGTLSAIILGYYGKGLLIVAMIAVGVVYGCNILL
ncbi:MAG: branched-chain amino acid transport [Clostridia bacterium]|jgi:branched-subunit amino acid transport protein|nr:branched-chain amino acid transport [Clostridia bacterium]